MCFHWNPNSGGKNKNQQKNPFAYGADLIPFPLALLSLFQGQNFPVNPFWRGKVGAKQDSWSLDEGFFWDQTTRPICATIPVNSMCKAVFFCREFLASPASQQGSIHLLPLSPSLGKGDGSCSCCQPLPTRILSLPRSRKKIHNNSPASPSPGCQGPGRKKSCGKKPKQTWIL